MKNKIYTDGRDIIVLKSKTKLSYIGFSLISEDVVSLQISKSIDVSDVLLKITSMERVRLLIAKSLCGRLTDVASALGKTERTVHRMLDVYFNKEK